ncbi:msf1 domain containing protein [Grosmannia clavigera kw1407]|uniref:Msf1 domain containing protein n=1 Tax=Grosmannia clavigera (strain kw1407 / UAMH 11150) TaxID=655863 RepID=F0XE91_GROCL|nr:msf1 domain containing protein [Grosmannia clavigera kw1407]EFX04148.1 msf1 domain containing protein [Grosmannia clavigera kw1407]
MVLTHTTNDVYSHPFPTVTLAYFLRYCSPQLNPFARHVLSTDTISSRVDAETGRLHTTRIHLKKSRLPKAVLKLLPTSVTGGMTDKASYILETSVIDMREGWMRSESRNLNYTGILSVVEQQLYTTSPPESQGQAAATSSTGVETNVIFRSRLGERIRERFEKGQHRYQQFKQQAQQHVQQSAVDDAHSGWFSTGWVSDLGAKGVQRSIEMMASTKTQDQLGKSREGMRMILERLRQTGIMGVLELRRRAMEGNLEAYEIQ